MSDKILTTEVKRREALSVKVARLEKLWAPIINKAEQALQALKPTKVRTG